MSNLTDGTSDSAPDTVFSADAGQNEATPPASAGANFTEPTPRQKVIEQYVASGMPLAAAQMQATIDENPPFESTIVNVKSQEQMIRDGDIVLIDDDTGEFTTQTSFSDGTTGIADASIAPSGAELQFLVKLTSRNNPADFVTFKVMPTINESRGASYDPVTPAHHPGGIPVYKTTGVRTFDLNGKFISRTIKEADETLRFINIIRSWVMPYYGRGTAANNKGALGAPPDVLTLYAYGNKHLNNIPVVLQNYNWSYPDDVDYIQTSNGEPVPIIFGVSVNLIEAYSAEELSAFDLAAFKSGNLAGAYNPSMYPRISDAPAAATPEAQPAQASYSNEGHNRAEITNFNADGKFLVQKLGTDITDITKSLPAVNMYRKIKSSVSNVL